MTGSAKGVRLPDLPGLDGMRALAVIAVLLYHAEVGRIAGGFLGVEVFFVISGYLITCLLLSEWMNTGRIDLYRFWLGRARRLLPALFVVLAATAVFAVFFLPQEVAGRRNDTLAALGYVTNWYLIWGQQSYFEMVGRPPLLQHLWSLAIEEQFYLLWPLLLAAGMWLWGGIHKRHRVLLLMGAAASTALMAALYQPGEDPSRLYYGTDTRAASLLIGSALAFVWHPRRFRVGEGDDRSAHHGNVRDAGVEETGHSTGRGAPGSGLRRLGRWAGRWSLELLLLAPLAALVVL